MSKSKNDNIIVLKLAISLVISIAYFGVVWLINRLMYKDFLYFCPKGAIISAFINCCLIMLGSFFINKNTIKWFKNKIKFFITVASIICCLLIPFLFSKSGTLADAYSIKKVNIFGDITQEYRYDDINNAKLFVKHGIEYDITFNSSDTIRIKSHEIIFLNNFLNGKNIVKFDKIISQKANIKVEPSIYMTQSNIKSFLIDKESFNYFNNIFENHY